MIYCHKYSTVTESAQKQESIDEKIIICAAILFLAGKSTENIRRIREVLNVVRHLFGLKSELLELKEVTFICLSLLTHSLSLILNLFIDSCE